MFGIVLPEILKERNDIKVLSADMSTPAGLDKVKKEFPRNYINVGIAEQNLIGMASGLSDEGHKCICEAQACFLSMRCFEQVRQFCGYMGIPLILTGYGSGFSLTFMGNTHYALEDIALMRTIPEMVILSPADSLEAAQAFESALNLDKPVYIRMFGGTGVPSVLPEDYKFELGKASLLRDGKDVNIVATGAMVKQALDASRILDETSSHPTNSV